MDKLVTLNHTETSYCRHPKEGNDEEAKLDVDTSEPISINKIQPNSKPKWSSTTSRKTEQNRRKHLIQKTGRERERDGREVGKRKET